MFHLKHLTAQGDRTSSSTTTTTIYRTFCGCVFLLFTEFCFSCKMLNILVRRLACVLENYNVLVRLLEVYMWKE